MAAGDGEDVIPVREDIARHVLARVQQGRLGLGEVGHGQDRVAAQLPRRVGHRDEAHPAARLAVLQALRRQVHVGVRALQPGRPALVLRRGALPLGQVHVGRVRAHGEALLAPAARADGPRQLHAQPRPRRVARADEVEHGAPVLGRAGGLVMEDEVLGRLGPRVAVGVEHLPHDDAHEAEARVPVDLVEPQAARAALLPRRLPRRRRAPVRLARRLDERRRVGADLDVDVIDAHRGLAPLLGAAAQHAVVQRVPVSDLDLAHAPPRALGPAHQVERGGVATLGLQLARRTLHGAHVARVVVRPPRAQHGRHRAVAEGAEGAQRHPQQVLLRGGHAQHRAPQLGRHLGGRRAVVSATHECGQEVAQQRGGGRGEGRRDLLPLGTDTPRRQRGAVAVVVAQRGTAAAQLREDHGQPREHAEQLRREAKLARPQRVGVAHELLLDGGGQRERHGVQEGHRGVVGRGGAQAEHLAVQRVLLEAVAHAQLGHDAEDVATGERVDARGERVEQLERVLGAVAVEEQPHGALQRLIPSVLMGSRHAHPRHLAGGEERAQPAQCGGRRLLFAGLVLRARQQRAGVLRVRRERERLGGRLERRLELAL
eukprot:scaffold82838_cov56-Phaeocystis_antarctica.AAC.3